MNNELLEKIEQLEKELASVKASLEKKEPEDLLWMPGDKETYFTIDSYGIVTTCSSYDPQYTEGAASFGNIFKDASAAAKHAKRLRLINKLFRLADALNDGWVPDWTRQNKKFRIVFDKYGNNDFSIDCSLSLVSMVAYFETREKAEHAITYLTDEDKQIMRECF